MSCVGWRGDGLRRRAWRLAARLFATDAAAVSTRRVRGLATACVRGAVVAAGWTRCGGSCLDWAAGRFARAGGAAPRFESSGAGLNRRASATWVWLALGGCHCAASVCAFFRSPGLSLFAAAESSSLGPRIAMLLRAGEPCVCLNRSRFTPCAL